MQIVNGFSSNLGEFRANHFHAGLDLRTFQKTGYPVRCMADGLVEVIRRDRNGTGLGIVIRHDNGYRSFTYHLDSLREDLQKILDEHVLRHANPYPGNIELLQGLRLQAGEIFAYSGESGSGFPHLHVEIRDAEGMAVNPLLLLDSPLPDRQGPCLHYLVVRARETTLINHQSREWRGQLSGDPFKGYSLAKPLVLDGPADWLVVAEDISDTGRPVAPYSLRFFLDEAQVLDLCFRELNRSHNRQLGLVYDRQYTSMGRYAFTLFTQAENTLYGADSQRFDELWNQLNPGEHVAKIEMRDAAGNSATARIPFFYLPHQAVKIEQAGDDTGHYVLSGDPALAPALLTIRLVDRSGRPVYNGQLTIDDLSSAQHFSLSRHNGLAVAALFELTKANRLIWFDRIDLLKQETRSAPVQPVWHINRDTVALFQADGWNCPQYLLEDGKPWPATCVRKTRDGEYRIFKLEPGTDIRVLGQPSRLEESSLLLLEPQKASTWSANGYSLGIEAGSVNMNRLLRIEPTVLIDPPLYPVCSPAITLSPAQLPLLKSARIVLKTVDLPDHKQLSFFVSGLDGRSWRCLNTQDHGDGRFSAALSVLGIRLALMRDIFPPVIGKGFLDPSAGRKRFLIRVHDKGKGIDYQSITVSCNQLRTVAEYDPDWDRIEVKLDNMKAGRYLLQVDLRDYAGHQAQKQFTVRIR